MGRPRVGELVLVRHGESEGNIARRRSLLGDHSVYAGEFLERHSSLWRLSDQGREQAIAAAVGPGSKGDGKSRKGKRKRSQAPV